MKTKSIVQLFAYFAIALLLSSCLMSCQATGFFRKVPVSRQGGWSEFRFRVLEAPDTWAPDLNPLLWPGDSENLDDPAERAALTARLHRANMRLITEDPARHIQEDMAEDWIAEMEWRSERIAARTFTPD